MITGILHPGAMGAALAATCAGEALWVGQGRSPATRRRADDVGLREVDSLDELAAEVEVIVSVCPPAAAVAQATGLDEGPTAQPPAVRARPVVVPVSPASISVRSTRSFLSSTSCSSQRAAGSSSGSRHSSRSQAFRGP